MIYYIFIELNAKLVITILRSEIRKNDELCAPIRVDEVNLKYLEAASNIFIRWKQSGNAGLTHQTFCACIQSMSAISELAEHLKKKHGFVYILLENLLRIQLKVVLAGIAK